MPNHPLRRTATLIALALCGSVAQDGAPVR
jgi:hypothetical protein